MSALIVYYAHPLTLYDKPQETMDIETLIALDFEVLNPNQPMHDAGYKREGMYYFRDLILSCNLLAFRAFPDGSIPAGVAKEIEFAVAYGYPVIEMPSALLRRTLSIGETREALTQGGRSS